MNKLLMTALAAALVSAGGSAYADVVTFNGAPTDGFHYGSGNNYAPANALVLDTADGDELALRFHVRQQVAPAATSGNVYTFTTAFDKKINFDWSIDSNSGFDGVTALITLTRLGAGGGTASYDPFFVGNDNHVANGSAQNSFQLGFAAVNGGPFGDINFDSTQNATYKINLTVNGLGGGTKQLNAYAVMGTGTPGFTPGGAVPEPTTWALMILGFGGAGAMLRRRNTAALAA